MNRREFITLLGGAAAWPLAARAQQRDRVRHIGVLMGGDENDPAAKLVSAFTQALADLGWTDGRADEMDPEDSCLWIHGTEDQQTTYPQAVVRLGMGMRRGAPHCPRQRL